jgi:hypothetical protein
VFSFSFLTLPAKLETLLKIVECLPSICDPTPTKQAKAQAEGLAKKGLGDGKVYSVALLKSIRAELADSSDDVCKCWIRLAVYVSFVLFFTQYLVHCPPKKTQLLF